MSKWKSLEKTSCRSVRLGTTGRQRLTDRQLYVKPNSFCVMQQIRHHLLRQLSVCVGNLEGHTHSPILGQAIQTVLASRGKEIEFPPSKKDLQIPINRSLEGLHSIKFHLPRWSGQSGSFFCLSSLLQTCHDACIKIDTHKCTETLT